MSGKKTGWEILFLLLQVILTLVALYLVWDVAREATAAAKAITDPEARATSLTSVLTTLLSWEVVSGLGVLVTIPKVPEIITAIKT